MIYNHTYIKMEEEIDLKQLLKLFWDKKILIIIMVVCAIAVGYVYSMYMVKPKYTASATLILAQKDASSDTGASAAVTSTDVTLNDKLIETYKELAKSNTVVREVIDNLHFTDLTDDDLKNEINVTAVKSTQILQISVTDADSEKSSKIANELTEVFSKKVAEIYKIDNISVVDKAETPTSPSNINHTKDITIFAIIGLVVSIGIILLMNMLDSTVKTAKDIESATGLLVLAELPECEFLSNKK